VGKDTVIEIVPENWLKRFPYQFNIIKNNGIVNQNLDFTNYLSGEQRTELGYDRVDNTNFKPFTLQINPESLNQDELFGINVSVTQSGTVSEHNGIPLRSLVLSGTTGVHPRRGTGGANSAGKVILGSRNLRSGYEEFLQLRNYFRAYAEAKAAGAASLQLLFVNRKDNEVLIVEPRKFSLKKTAARATLYEYNVTFDCIGNHNPNFIEEEDFISKLDDSIAEIQDVVFQARGALLAASGILRNIDNTVSSAVFGPLRQLDLALTELVNLPKQLSHMSDDLVNRFSNSATLKILTDTKATIKNLQKGLPPTTPRSNAAEKQGLGTDRVSFPTNLGNASTNGGAALLALGSLALTQMPL
jgi:hypothetical protein